MVVWFYDLAIDEHQVGGVWFCCRGGRVVVVVEVGNIKPTFSSADDEHPPSEITSKPHKIEDDGRVF